MVRDKFGVYSEQTPEQISTNFYFYQRIQMKNYQSVKGQGDFPVLYRMMPMNIICYFSL